MINIKGREYRVGNFLPFRLRFSGHGTRTTTEGKPVNQAYHAAFTPM
ncbi:hypothetical protein PCO87_02925 [Pectobacteriaceae bacterium C52]|nr:hypothetical protein PCO87_02925 [Pectobacteriaceae bacterium C52]